MHICIIFLVFINITINAQNWEIQNSGVNNRLNDVYFIDELHGWAIGHNSTIIATTDGGNNWHIQSSPIDSVEFKHVQFVNESVGYIVGYTDDSNHDGIIIDTEDGGNTWAISKIDTNYGYFDLSFVSLDTGWVVGGGFIQTKKRGVILKTTNGGQAWVTQYETDTSDYYFEEVFTAIEFIDGTNGWVFGGDFFDNFSSTFVYRTIDGGLLWNIVGEVYRPVFEIDIAEPDTIWSGGYSGVGISTNGGVDWTIVNDDPDIISNKDVELLNGHTGWYIGSTATGSKILQTEDSAVSWTEILTNQVPYLKSIYALSTDLIWVVGDSGIVMHYSNDSVSVTPDTENTPQIFELKQNYPNPFNTNTLIGFYIHFANSINLEIYNINGNEIITLMSGHFEPGHYKLMWDGKTVIKKMSLPVFTFTKLKTFIPAKLKNCYYYAKLIFTINKETNLQLEK